MTIETITDLIHVQECSQKRNWSDKSGYQRNKKRPEYQRQKYEDIRCGQR